MHALTTGAVGVMALAVMTRASLGHTGRPRHAGPVTVFIYTIYTLVTLGAMLRIFGPTTDLPATLVLGLAAVGWSGAYVRPGLWPVPSSPQPRRVTEQLQTKTPNARVSCHAMIRRGTIHGSTGSFTIVSAGTLEWSMCHYKT